MEKKDFRYADELALEIYKRTGEENYLKLYDALTTEIVPLDKKSVKVGNKKRK